MPESLRTSDEENMRRFLGGVTERYAHQTKKLSPGEYKISPKGNLLGKLTLPTAVIAEFRAQPAGYSPFGVDFLGERFSIPRDAEGLVVIAGMPGGGKGVFDIVAPHVYKSQEPITIPERVAIL